MLEIDNLKKELSYSISRNHQLAKDKEILSNNILFLEEELSKTIETYSKMIKDLACGNSEINMTVVKELNNSILAPSN